MRQTDRKLKRYQRRQATARHEQQRNHVEARRVREER